MLRELLTEYLGLVIAIFLISSMLSLGLDLTIRQIIEPLRSRRLVAKSLFVSVLVVPLIAFALATFIPMHEGFQIGLILYGLAAGAEGGPKFVQLMRGNTAFALGLLAVLLTFTVVVLPLLLSMVIPDLQFQRGALLIKLLMIVALPIGLGLFLKARFAKVAERLSPVMHRASMFFLWTLFLMVIYIFYHEIVSLEMGVILAGVLFYVLTFTVGYLAGGSSWENRRALAVMTYARNGTVAMMIASQVFMDEPKVPVMITIMTVVSVVLGVLLIVYLRRWDSRNGTNTGKSV